MANNTDSAQEKKGVYYTLPNNKYVKEYREILIDKSGKVNAEAKAKAYVGHINFLFMWVLWSNCKHSTKEWFIQLISGKENITTQFGQGLALSSIMNCTGLMLPDVEIEQACIPRIISKPTLDGIANTLKIDREYITGDKHLLEECSDKEITLFMLAKELMKACGENLECLWAYKFLRGEKIKDNFEILFEIKEPEEKKQGKAKEKPILSEYAGKGANLMDIKKALQKDSDMIELFLKLSNSGYGPLYKGKDVLSLPETDIDKVLYYLKYETDVSDKGDELTNMIYDRYLDPLKFNEYLERQKRKMKEENKPPEDFIRFMRVLERYWGDMLALVQYWKIVSISSEERERQVWDDISRETDLEKTKKRLQELERAKIEALDMEEEVNNLTEHNTELIQKLAKAEQDLADLQEAYDGDTLALQEEVEDLQYRLDRVQEKLQILEETNGQNE